MKHFLFTGFLVTAFSISTFSKPIFLPNIINGIDAIEADSISTQVVALQMPNIESDGSVRFYKGTAFIIGDDLLMTVAHNLFYLADKSKVEAIFALKPNYGLDPIGQLRIPIENYKIHPDFYSDSSGAYNDIAIIKLKNKIPNYYKSLQFDWTLILKADTLLTIAGYGVTTEYGQVDPKAKQLRFTKAPLIGGNQADLNASDKIIIDQSKSGFCGGDSGGPVLVETQNGLVPVGIVSHILQSSNGDWSCRYQSAATRITYFKDWILKSVAELTYIYQ